MSVNEEKNVGDAVVDRKTNEAQWDYCPSCAGDLDTGFECNKCGRDWRPWATLRLNVTESEAMQ